ncbi:type I polyketide synthase [Streptomyces cavernae]|uniref:type I polyketide synthase n=1 Tax=Streptomyces cavernae TaxID=2259034 RepID=UPI000FEBBCBB|nr:type I polyketide synthase [Streptomyces cavernae]
MTEDDKLRTYLRRVTAELQQTRTRLQEEKARASEPLAIIGMGARFPGGVDTPQKLWQLVADGVDAIGGFPVDRGWDLASLYDPDPDAPGKTYTDQGAFLSGAGEFDPAPFGISPREAESMDPQQRLLLETSWEAVENAGIDPLSLRGSSTGVFVGGNAVEHTTLLMSSPRDQGYALTGGSGSVLSGRVSYTLGLAGPAVTVDTACSSSLVALHLATQALRQGECGLALAAGTGILATPSAFITLSRQHGLASDGRCKAFSGDADGIGWGEGVGVLLLERLSDAQRNGHPVLAVLRGSAVNQDGASNGLSAPNGPAQEAVIRAALANAGLLPSDVDLVEAHGTGTSLGDPIEAQALLATYGQDRDEPAWLGSIKTNIGHTQVVSGVAGVIKAVHAIRAAVLPKTLNVSEPTPEVDWSAGNVRLLTEARPWPDRGRPRRAAVSSFGISGTNAHVVIEQAPADADGAPGTRPDPDVLPFVLSAASEKALAGQARRLAAHLAADPEPALADVGFSLATTRAALEHRAVVVGTGRDDLLAGLDAVAAGRPDPRVVTGAAGKPKVAFVFPGQGAQWAGMGRELWDTSPVFADWMGRCEEALSPHVDWSLREVVEHGDYDRVDVLQPVTWAVMVSLAQLWRSYGVEPGAVVGHSQGEIAAAVVAGALSLQDGARIVTLRSAIAVERMVGRGCLTVVAVGRDEAERRLRPWAGRLSVGASNGPASTVLTGEADAIDEFVAACIADGVRVRKISATFASHGPQADVMRAPVVEGLRDLKPSTSSVAFYSTVTADRFDTAGADAEYWFRNLREPVEFAATAELMMTRGFSVFIEVSPHPVLAMALRDVAEAADSPVVTVGSLRRDEGGLGRCYRSLAEAFTAGVPVRWAEVFPDARRVPLPTYAFDHRTFWLTPEPPPVAEDPLGGAFWGKVENADVAGLAADLGVPAEGALGEVVPALAAWRRRSRELSETDGWSYRTQWRPVPPAPGAVLDGRWLVLVPEDVDGTAVLDALDGTDITTLEVPGTTDRASLAADLSRFADVTGVLSLLALREGREPRHDVVPRSATGVLLTAQALADAGLDAALWIVTRCAGETGEPAQAWALAQVAGLERPATWGGVVDLPADWDGRGLVTALTSQEDQLALRPDGVLARRLVRAPLSLTAPSRSWQPRGTVLITGGTGGIGAHLARWAAAEGAEHLVLTSRRGRRAPGAAELVAELGIPVTVEACDVADRDALAGVLARIPADRPLSAVLHTAGTTLGYRELADTTVEDLAEAAAGKVAGARHLDELTAGLDLDAFVLFSSGAAMWGSAGSAAYASANGFLHGLAADRRTRGLPATAIAWGAWQGGGMSTGDTADVLGRIGFGMMAPKPAITALRRAVERDETVLAVADLDWERFAPSYAMSRRRPLIADIPEAVRALEGGAAPEATETSLREALSGLDPAKRREHLTDLVRAEAAVVLRIPSPRDVGITKAFQDMGVDSLTAMEMRNRLQTASGLRLPVTLLFDHPTVRELAAELDSLLGGARTEAVTVAAPVADTTDPIVIVGMACRFPGGVTEPDDLWRLVAEGRDEMGDFPTGRGWETMTAQAGLTYTEHGAFLYDAGMFDAGFFGVSPREAMAMDPQQRVLLESSWEALERAGVDPTSLRGSRTGVFVGGTTQEYSALTMNSAAALGAGYALTGTSGSVLSGRVSYVLGLEGPAVTVDTACSSSLVSLHLAVQSLRNHECDLALAGGVTVMSTPGVFAEFARQGGLAGDGRCKSYAEGADGTGWGEGVGVVVVERLSDARRNNHHVLAVVRGSAINQDGASNGLTAPNGPSQQRVIRAALAGAGLEPADVDVVEGHGTGTALGDPIEAQALLATYGQDREIPAYLGSVKSNIGHTQYAAGVAGVIKMVLALREGVIPATLHVTEPTGQVEWSAGAVHVVSEQREWPETGRVRRAGVSSFGMSGTNAHVILEAPQEPQEPDEPPASEPAGTAGPVPLVVSGRSPAAVHAQAERLTRFLDARPGLPPADVAWSLVSTRARLEHGAVVHADGRPPTTESAVEGGLGWLFTGQGTQRLGMGAELHARYPVFADTWDEITAQWPSSVLDAWGLADLAPVLAAGPGAPAGDIDRTGTAQLLLFAFEVSLARLLISWGVRPEAVVGHSIGELAAACVAGLWSVPDACRIVVARAGLMQALPPGGAMWTVGASETEVAGLLGDGISVAAVNSARSIVLSGPGETLSRAVGTLRERGVHVRQLRVSHAFHSPLMEPMLDRFRTVVESVAYREPAIPVLATGGGRTDVTDPRYWVAQVTGTVRFADAVTAGMGSWLEIGPAPALSTLVGDGLAAVRGPETEAADVLETAGRLWLRGHDVDWAAVLPGRRRVDLPTYAFQHQHYWLNAPATAATPPGLTAVTHPMLSASLTLADSGAAVLTGRLDPAAQPWLAEHVLADTPLLPGTAFVELALQAALHTGCDTVLDLTLPTPLVLASAMDVQVGVDAPDEHGQRPVTVRCREAGAAADDPWTLHASATVGVAQAGTENTGAESWPPQDAEEIALDTLYADIAAGGVDYGPTFQGLRRLWRHKGDLFAEVDLRDHLAADGLALHPAVFDAALQPLALGVLGDGAPGREAVPPGLPFAWTSIRLHRTGATHLRARLTPSGRDGASVVLTDGDGDLVLSVESLVLRAPAQPRVTPPLYRVDWPAAGTGGRAPAQVTVLGTDPWQLATRLRDSGLDVTATDDPHTAAPDVVVVACGGAPGTVPEAAHATTRRALDILRARIDHGGPARLVVVTAGAIAAGDEDVPDPAAAPVWGLVRTAQNEHPGLVSVVDLDGSEASYAALPAALGSDEPQLALRDGVARAPRLARLGAETGGPAAEFDAARTVLVTGAGGALAGLVARHLVVAHGVRHLLLAGRRGPAAPGTGDLVAELTALGATVRAVACDVADRTALADLLASVDPAAPLGAVVHTAGVVHDGLVATMTGDQLAEVLRPKVDAAWALHEMTASLDLSAFVLFSSAAGVLGSAGQGNYAAANTFLDALAHRRRAEGRPALSPAWGWWDLNAGMSAALGDQDRDRMRKGGLLPFDPARGLAAFDSACAGAEPAPVPIRLDTARTGDRVPPVLRTPARPGPRPARTRTDLRDLPHAQRHDALTELVRTEAARVLGHDGAEEIGARSFPELGFDSLTSVELRNRLAEATGLRLPPTLVFDHPTVTALVTALEADLGDTAPEAPETSRDTAVADSVEVLYREACGAGRFDVAAKLLTMSAALRPVFTAADTDVDGPAPVRLTSGSAHPRIIGIPSTSVWSTDQEFMSLVEALRGQRDVWSLMVPGFVGGERVAEDVDALTGYLAARIVEHAGGEPFVLAGRSSGGSVAHAVAHRLESTGHGPAAVVLLDTYLSGTPQTAYIMPVMEQRSLELEKDFGRMSGVRLTAMAAYFSMFETWQPQPLAAPTLLVRASECFSAEPGEEPPAEEWQTTWPIPLDVVDVPGHHYTMIEQYADETAAAIHDWLLRH